MRRASSGSSSEVRRIRLLASCRVAELALKRRGIFVAHGMCGAGGVCAGSRPCQELMLQRRIGGVGRMREGAIDLRALGCRRTWGGLEGLV